MSVLLSKHKKELRKFDKNMKWFQSNYEKLRETYAGEYIAVNNGEVVSHDKDVRTLVMQLREQHKDIGAFVIEFVSKEKFELIL
jgi:hypothetical protein